ncbi:MAG: hypothetical protein ACREHG_06000 [Candidatus Saccharimonadales bacterium]
MKLPTIGINLQKVIGATLLVFGVYLLIWAYLMEIEIGEIVPPPESGPSPQDVSALFREAEGIANAQTDKASAERSEVGPERP